MSPSSSEALKVHKDSHAIKKQSSSSPSSCNAVEIGGPLKPKQHRPVIIYTHPPKVIHTSRDDFMALVQKLTGLERSESSDPPSRPPAEEEDDGVGDRKSAKIGVEEIGSPSAVTEDNGIFPMYFDPMANYLNGFPFMANQGADFSSSTAMMAAPFYDCNSSDGLMFEGDSSCDGLGSIDKNLSPPSSTFGGLSEFSGSGF